MLWPHASKGVEACMKCLASDVHSQIPTILQPFGAPAVCFNLCARTPSEHACWECACQHRPAEDGEEAPPSSCASFSCCAAGAGACSTSCVSSAGQMHRHYVQDTPPTWAGGPWGERKLLSFLGSANAGKWRPPEEWTIPWVVKLQQSLHS